MVLLQPVPAAATLLLAQLIVKTVNSPPAHPRPLAIELWAPSFPSTRHPPNTAAPLSTPHTMADFEALKDQWSQIEDTDGVRLSWNTLPSSRMVRTLRIHRSIGAMSTHSMLTCTEGSLAARCPHRCSIHAIEGEDRHSAAPI